MPEQIGLGGASANEIRNPLTRSLANFFGPRELEPRGYRAKYWDEDLVAHHFTQAGLSERATEWWRKAGDRALKRSANLEAVAHYRKALGLLESVSNRGHHANEKWNIRVWLEDHHARIARMCCLAVVLGVARSGITSRRAAMQSRLWLCAGERRRFPVGASPTPANAPAGSNRSSYGRNEVTQAFG